MTVSFDNISIYIASCSNWKVNTDSKALLARLSTSNNIPTFLIPLSNLFSQAIYHKFPIY
jgi:hypothetical protein